MKRNALFGLILFTFFLSACQFNQSVNKDLKTGAYSKGNGISVNNVTIQIADEMVNRNSFIDGETVNFVFNGIDGLTKENGKVFPGLAMFIIKNEKDTLQSNLDLLSNLNEGTDLNPLKLTPHFSAKIASSQDKYKVYIKIWDKKGTGIFTYEMPYTVEVNKVLQITTNNLTYKNIYLWNDDSKLVITDKNISAKSKLILVLEEVVGLEKLAGKVYPKLAIELIDHNGNKILSNANVLKDYEVSGIGATAFEKGQLPITITLKPGQLYNPFKLMAVLTDKNSGKSISIKTTLEIK